MTDGSAELGEFILSKLFSGRKNKKYIPMTFGKHSELRLSSKMYNVDLGEIIGDSGVSIYMEAGYMFTDDRRKNRLMAVGRGKALYGSRKSFRNIYAQLVKWNGGKPFIETYFETHFKRNFGEEVKVKTDKLLNDLVDEYINLISLQTMTKSGDFKKSTKAYRKLGKYEKWREGELSTVFDDLSHRIKKDVGRCLATGKIPLMFNYKSTANTPQVRKRLGLLPLRKFFATGQLIDNLVITFSASYQRSL
jgi:hypothetical protein